MSEKKGRFGMHGGQYIPETLMNAVQELDAAYEHYKHDPGFQAELTALLNDYAGRPSRLYYAGKVTADLGGAKVYLKREDLNHTGAHKINNVLGQALLAKRMGKTRLIAETGAGQHGVATATAAALMGMECVVFMGEEDTKRQALNVYRMRLLGAEVVPVTSGTGTLKDACSAAFREWTNRISDTHYCIGSVMGPHPFPTMVRDFQAVISKEIKEQLLEKEGKLPDAVIACVGGGSNAIGAFYHFINDPSVRLIGCEAAGRGVDTAETAATIATGRPGIFHGMKSYFCQISSARSRRCIPFPPALITPASGRSTPISMTSDGRNTSPSPTRRPWMPLSISAAWRALFPPSNPPMPWPTPESWPLPWAGIGSSLSTFPAGATRTARPSPASAKAVVLCEYVIHVV